LSAVAFAGAAAAQDDDATAERKAGVYVRLGAGVNFARDLDQDLTYNPSTIFAVTPPTRKATDVGSGGAYAAAIGFQYPGRTRTELEYRRLGADIDATTFSGGFNPPATFSLDENLRVQTLMSNVYFDITNASRLTPYVGVGVGGAWVRNELDERDAAFAYQGRAGVELALGGGLSVGAEYVYLRTLDIAFGPKEFEPTGPVGPQADGAPYVSSSIMATLRKTF